MTFRHVLASVVLGLAVLARAQPATADPRPFDHARLAQAALDRVIRPGYRRLADAGSQLASRMQRPCAAHAPRASHKAIVSAFDAFVSAWGQIEMIDFGPIARENRRERILFWPDRRGLGARQVEKALRSRDAAVTDAAVLAGKSVALQGLGALETVLFTPTAGLDPAEVTHRCRYGAAVAANLSRIAHELSQAWSGDGGFAGPWLSPGASNPHFLQASETTLALIKAYDRGLERVRDDRIAGPLGLTAQRRRMPAVLSKSNRTLRLVLANIEGLRDLWITSGLQTAIVATNTTHESVSVPANAQLVANELTTARDVARKLALRRQPFESPAMAQRLIALGFPLKNARVQATALLELTAGLALGFNASDGD